MTLANAPYRDRDALLWEQYRASGSPAQRDALLRRCDGILQSQVNR